MRTHQQKLTVSIALAALLLLSYFQTAITSHGALPDSIVLGSFRWTTFPLKVLVDMNQWSLPSYAAAVREAVDNWMKSIWNYTHSYNDTSLSMIRYVFFVSNINKTGYDVLISFAPNEIAPPSNAVGLTTAKWNTETHEPLEPVIINITTYSATADTLFVRNIAMHEFGHALGLGHAYQQNTQDGPELMYRVSSRNQFLYPSTLDVYGLTLLYKGQFEQDATLPSDIPYIMLAEGTVPPPTVDFWEPIRPYLPLLLAALVTLIIIATVWNLKRKDKTAQLAHEAPSTPDNPPPPPTT